MRIQSRYAPNGAKTAGRRGCAPAPEPGCGRRSSELDSFAKIVADYRRYYADTVAEDKAFFGDASQSPAEAVRRACLSRRRDGRLHDHQHRIGYDGMAEAAEFMTPFVDALMSARDFAELHERVAVLRGGVERIGDLAIYDIAQRIGWYLGIEPTEIYLHRGTREGARMLVPGVRGKSMSPALLPQEFRTLSPAQLEDVLCIYKAEIRQIVGCD